MKLNKDNLMRLRYQLIAVAAVLVLLDGVADGAAQEPAAVLELMQRVATSQNARPPLRGTKEWIMGACYAGMMAADAVLPEPSCRTTMMTVGTGNQWQLGPSIYNADDLCVGQTYAELYLLHRDPAMLQPMRAAFDRVLAVPLDPKAKKPRGMDTDWTWCDTLFMAPPAWSRLYAATGERKYLSFALSNLWENTAALCDKDEHLFYRDARFIGKREKNGKKVFWSRGNGWVVAGIARVLQDMPEGDPARAPLEQQFRELCTALLDAQGSDGMWRASLLDPKAFPGKETSGSGFITFAFAWGVNAGLLDRAKFGTAALRGWNCLAACVTPEGNVHYCQPVGEEPEAFEPSSSMPYGVGAFLLAGSEVYKMQILDRNRHVAVTALNELDLFRPQETIELDIAGLLKAMPGAMADSLAVMDGAAARWIPSQLLDANSDGKPETLLFQSDFQPRHQRGFIVVGGIDRGKVPEAALRASARFVPERLDDFFWENDRTAHRMYGPALGKQDGSKTGSGIDVWCKHVRQPVMMTMLKENKYHQDNGLGVDCYDVGNRRGCGGTAVWSGSKLYPPFVFAKWKLVANGPVRASFELTYEPWDAAGRKISEVKRISLDVGSNLSRFDTRFTTDNAQPLTIAVGINDQGAKGELAKDEAGRWMAYWDADVKGNGRVGCAVVIPSGTVRYAHTASQHVLLADTIPGKTFVHYAGAAWSKGLDIADAAAWKEYARDFARRLGSPLTVRMGK